MSLRISTGLKVIWVELSKVMNSWWNLSRSRRVLICVFVCVCQHTLFMCSQACGGQRPILGSSSISRHTIFENEPRACQFSKISCPSSAGTSCLPPQHCGDRCTATPLLCFLRSHTWQQNPGLQACEASAFPTEQPPSQDYKYFILLV